MGALNPMDIEQIDRTSLPDVFAFQTSGRYELTMCLRAAATNALSGIPNYFPLPSVKSTFEIRSLPP
jgi:hypothetical protein